VYFSLGIIEGSEDLIIENLNNLKTSNSQKIDNFKLLEKIYRITGSTEQLLAVKDSIIFYNENQSSLLINEQFNTLENFILISDKQNDIKIYQARNTRLILISIFSLIILSLVTVSYRFNYALQKEKNKRLALEKEKIQNKLKLKQRELFSKVNFITQRNDYLNRIKSKLESKESDSEDLKNEISNIANSEKAYSEFDKMFSQVYPDFYKNLNIHGKLSQTDIRLASYIKMNHSNNEIARISGISIRTVESQRYRLSKKLNISADEDLNSFISKL
jgi:DNA-binding CsgD family transcriptional regulator